MNIEIFTPKTQGFLNYVKRIRVSRDLRSSREAKQKIAALIDWLKAVKTELPKPQPPALVELLSVYYDNRNKGEVDYLIDDYKGLATVPIEVKSGKDYTIHSALTRVTLAMRLERHRRVQHPQSATFHCSTETKQTEVSR